MPYHGKFSATKHSQIIKTSSAACLLEVDCCPWGAKQNLAAQLRLEMKWKQYEAIGKNGHRQEHCNRCNIVFAKAMLRFAKLPASLAQDGWSLRYSVQRHRIANNLAQGGDIDKLRMKWTLKKLHANENLACHKACRKKSAIFRVTYFEAATSGSAWHVEK